MKPEARSPRVCLRCERAFEGKAGLLIKDRPVCPSCAPNFRIAAPCSECGRLSKRLHRNPAGEGLVCEPCQRRSTHATCQRCRRHRRMATRDSEGRPVCSGCSGNEAATHVCPDCEQTTPGTGSAPCQACGLARRLDRRIKLNSAVIDQEWARSLFLEFCSWDGLRKTAGNMSGRIDAYTDFFDAMGRNFGSADAINQTDLLRLFDPEGLRRNFLVVDFLVERLKVTWTAEVAAVEVEQRRIVTILAAHAGEAWVKDLDRFRRSLQAGKPVTLRTVRSYLSAAASLLGDSGVAMAAELTQSHASRYLRRKPGQTASIQRFLSWVEATHGQSFVINPRNQPSQVGREKASLRQMASILDKLDTTSDPRGHKALLAHAVALLYQIPLQKILSLTNLDVRRRDSQTVLWPDTLDITLDLALGERIDALTVHGGRYIFAGRNSTQPLSVSAVAYHVRK